MNPTLQIRPARPSDASFAAPLIYLTMGYLADHLFQRKREVIEEMLVRLFAREAGRFGYGNAFVGEVEHRPVGVMLATRGREISRLNCRTFPQLVAVLGLIHAFDFTRRGIALPGGAEASDDEFFIGNLAVLPSMQGRSFGSQMISHAEHLAQGNNLTKCSLIVGWHNTNAKRLYERIGYQVVETVPDEKDDLGYYRMVKVL